MYNYIIYNIANVALIVLLINVSLYVGMSIYKVLRLALNNYRLLIEQLRYYR